MTDRTIIIGAGAAGLAAGATLRRAGREVVVLEARDRIGGRVHTVHDQRWELPLEFGAEFIHGRPIESWEIVHQKHLQAYDVTNDHWLSHRGKPLKESDDWKASEIIMERLANVPGDTTFDEFLTRHCGDISAGGRAMAKAFVEGLDAADASQVSVQSLAASEADGEAFDADTPFRLVNGYDQLLQPFAAVIEKSLHLNTAVRSIEWSRGQVSVQAVDGRRFDGNRVIITLPIGVLLAKENETGAIRFVPPLPARMRKAIEQMRMGAVIKVLMRFNHAMWEDRPWRDLAFVHSAGDVFPTWWTMLPFRVPMLTAWAGGPAAMALSNRTPTQVLDAALLTLSKLIDVDIARLHLELVAWHVSDWQADPFARGAYAYTLVGGADAVNQLADPIDDTLFFAGEATHPGYAGTVAAAIASGYRAANQIRGRITS